MKREVVGWAAVGKGKITYALVRSRGPLARGLYVNAKSKGPAVFSRLSGAREREREERYAGP
jgi:hypothetical protein